MALTKEDLLAIAELMDARLDAKLDAKLTSALTPINQRLDTMQAQINTLQGDVGQLKKDMAHMQEDMDEVKENTAITRLVVNELGEWAEAASRTLDIRYPLRKAE